MYIDSVPPVGRQLEPRPIGHHCSQWWQRHALAFWQSYCVPFVAIPICIQDPTFFSFWIFFRLITCTKLFFTDAPHDQKRRRQRDSSSGRRQRTCAAVGHACKRWILDQRKRYWVCIVAGTLGHNVLNLTMPRLPSQVRRERNSGPSAGIGPRLVGRW